MNTRPRSITLAAAVALAFAAPAPAFCQGTPGNSPSEFTRFVRDVAGDYKGYFSKGVALRLGIGGAAAGIVHIWDQDIADEAAESSSTPEAADGGNVYGGPTIQWPLAIGWWAISHVAHSNRGADAGRDLLRAQISTASWTHLIKLATDRDRPNGESWAFPSGHTSAAFATATVLTRHYGWKMGVPFYALGVYTGASRIAAEKHWTSDVVFGAAVGIASGYTVTRHLGTRALTFAPAVSPRSAGILVTLGP